MEENGSQTILIQAFFKACKYLQYNPPISLQTAEEVSACTGAATYEEGWRQWANYFINEVSKENNYFVNEIMQQKEVKNDLV